MACPLQSSKAEHFGSEMRIAFEGLTQAYEQLEGKLCHFRSNLDHQSRRALGLLKRLDFSSVASELHTVCSFVRDQGQREDLLAEIVISILREIVAAHLMPMRMLIEQLFEAFCVNEQIIDEFLGDCLSSIEQFEEAAERSTENEAVRQKNAELLTCKEALIAMQHALNELAMEVATMKGEADTPDVSELASAITASSAALLYLSSECKDLKDGLRQLSLHELAAEHASLTAVQHASLQSISAALDALAVRQLSACFERRLAYVADRLQTLTGQNAALARKNRELQKQLGERDLLIGQLRCCNLELESAAKENSRLILQQAALDCAQALAERDNRWTTTVEALKKERIQAVMSGNVSRESTRQQHEQKDASAKKMKRTLLGDAEGRAFKVVLCGIHSAEEARTMQTQLQQLGATVLDGPGIPKGTTHLVTPHTYASPRSIYGLFSGRWVVNVDWVADSANAGKPLAESFYGTRVTEQKRRLLQRVYYSRAFEQDPTFSQLVLVARCNRSEFIRADLAEPAHPSGCILLLAEGERRDTSMAMPVSEFLDWLRSP